MIIKTFKSIEKLQKEVNSLRETLVTCKKLAKRELIKKQIKDLELEIFNLKKITDIFLVNCINECDKKIIIDHYYNTKTWATSIGLHVTYKGDYNTDSYRRYIHRLLSRSY